MQPQGPTFWLLDGRIDERTGWRTAYTQQVSVSRTGLRLAANPTGPLDLTSSDGSLGGLI